MSPADVLGCIEAVVAFTCSFDEGDAEAAASWFAEDGQWERREGTVTGRQALAALVRARGTVMARHVLSNQRVARLGADRAVVDSYVTAYRSHEAARPAPLDQPFLVGRYRDELVRTAGRWCICKRALTIDFQGS